MSAEGHKMVGDKPQGNTAAIDRQRAELERLQIASVRRMYLQWLVDARREPSEEPEPSRFARPAVELIRRLRGDGDPIPVVRGRIVTPAYTGRQLERLQETVAQFGFTRGEDRDDRVLRFVVRQDEEARARTATATEQALRAVRAAGLRADPIHLLSLAWDMKGGDATAEPTDGQPDRGQPCDGEPLVVVVDTGLYGAADTRDDGFLDTVELDQASDEDLLDVLDAAGAVVPHGTVVPGEDGDGDIDLAAGHGTFVAGIVTQVAPNATVKVIKALATDGAGTDDQLVEAIDRAAGVFAANGGRGVLNLSLGGNTVDDRLPHQVAAALDGLPPEVLVVAAAGNCFDTRPLFPAADKRVIAVGAVDGDQNPTTWSNHGPWVDFSTTGEGLISTFVPGDETPGQGPNDPFDDDPDSFGGDNPYATWIGTSFATPQVSAWLACFIAEHPQQPASEAVVALRAQGVAHPDLGHIVEIL
jgi:hypothetical protein